MRQYLDDVLIDKNDIITALEFVTQKNQEIRFFLRFHENDTWMISAFDNYRVTETKFQIGFFNKILAYYRTTETCNTAM